MTPVPVGTVLPERVLTIRLTAADLNAALSRVSAVQVSFANGCFEVAKEIALVTLSLRIHPDVGPGRLRLAIPFAEIHGVRGAGWLVRKALPILWNWLDAKLEDTLSNELAAHGLPWDLVWVDGQRDASGSKVATINISPTVLNDWLQQQPLPGLDGLAARLAGVAVEPAALVLRVQLVPRHIAFGADDEPA